MNEWNDSNIGDALGAGLQGGDTAIWLAHSPPLGAHYDVGGRYDEHLGSAALRELVEQERPRLVLCGHVH